MSDFRFECSCGQHLIYDESLCGKLISCPSCNSPIYLPENNAANDDKTTNLSSCSDESQNIEQLKEDSTTPVQSSQSQDKEQLLCKCYLCNHKYDAREIASEYGVKIFCPKCHKEIYCQGYEKSPEDYLEEYGFTINYSYKDKLYIDDVTKRVGRFFMISKYFMIIPYESIISWDITQEQYGTTTRFTGNLEGKRTASVVGTLLAGPSGAIIGSAGEKNINITATNDLRYKYHINVFLNDMEHSSFAFKDLYLEKMEEITSKLNLIKHYNMTHPEPTQKRSVIRRNFDPAPCNYFEREEEKIARAEAQEFNRKVKIGCGCVIFIIVFILIMLFSSCVSSCKQNRGYSSYTPSYSYTSQSSKNDLAKKKRIAKWIRECDDREWQNPDGDIAIKKAAKYFGISESEARNIALEGLSNGW